MLNIQVPLSLLREKVSLNWSAVDFGRRNGWLHADTVVELAMDRVANEVRPAPDLLELASALPHESGRVQYLVGKLAGSDGELTKDKWLYLLLAWITNIAMSSMAHVERVA